MKSPKQQSAHILLPYENKWVALTPDGTRVLASGISLKTVDKKLRASKKRGVLTYVPSFDTRLVP